MALPFLIDEFEITVAQIKSRGLTIGTNLGVTQTPSTLATINGSFHRLADGQMIVSGSNGLTADAMLITTDSATVVNGNILAINSDTYEVLGADFITSWLGSYTKILLRQVKE